MRHRVQSTVRNYLFYPDMGVLCEQAAKEERRSKSDIFREMYSTYMFKKTLTKVQKSGARSLCSSALKALIKLKSILGNGASSIGF